MVKHYNPQIHHRRSIRLKSCLPHHFENLEIDAAVIMPNHFYGIICTGLVSKSLSKSLRWCGNPGLGIWG
ncbi:hypothetical protein [Coleofasciculus sp. E2-BRE-01]|uniref:hypothetical protein n=1 Tax=Coleofasciculus sp. E2-BRE-01 TaxID=3069524 RepID=UPI0040631734